MLRADDREWLADLCASRGVALIADEVFADYRLHDLPDAASLTGETRALTFSLGGLSKSAGLPQVKLGWMAVSGPDESVGEALARLELISDTYLSVSTPVQLAAARLMKAGLGIRDAISARLRQNLECLRRNVERYPSISLFEPEGGWSAVIRVPALTSEEELVLQLLEQAHVLVHPGYFFDFNHEAFLVLSLIPEPAGFAAALDRLLPMAAGGARA
jgi:aspartate/methionine/tyrosine aminotransferase